MTSLVDDVTDETVPVFGGGPVGARTAGRVTRVGRGAREIVVGADRTGATVGGAEGVWKALDTPGINLRWTAADVIHNVTGDPQ